MQISELFVHSDSFRGEPQCRLLAWAAIACSQPWIRLTVSSHVLGFLALELSVEYIALIYAFTLVQLIKNSTSSASSLESSSTMWYAASNFLVVAYDIKFGTLF